MPVCPLCMRNLSALNMHIKIMHNMENKEEQCILLAEGQVNIWTFPCPVSRSTYLLTQLDHHIRQTHMNTPFSSGPPWSGQALDNPTAVGLAQDNQPYTSQVVKQIDKLRHEQDQLLMRAAL